MGQTRSGGDQDPDARGQCAQGGWATDGFKLYVNTWTADGLVGDHKVILETGDGAGTGAAAATEPDAVPVDAWSQVVSLRSMSPREPSRPTSMVSSWSTPRPVVADMNTSLPNGPLVSCQLAMPVAADWFWTGGIDDVQIYSGLLSDAQAGWLHANPGSVVPEPSTVVMLLIAAAGLLVFRHRRAA